jgi:2-isopropylmalate synthase
MSERVLIFDTTLRDGEQSPGCSMTTAEKLRVARRSVDLGVDILEAGFPIASAGDFEAVREVGKQFGRDVCVAALARAVPLDIERALNALETAQNPRLHCFIATSEIHLKYKFKKTQEQILDEAVRAVTLAKAHVDDVEFSAEDATRTEVDYLCRISKAVVDAGATTVNIPDTVGFMVPEHYAEIIRSVVEAVGDRAVVSVHTHDDLGLAVANSIAALHAGARQIECAMNGIGERAGNCSLEEVAMIMNVRNDRVPFHTKLRTELLYPTSRTLTECITFGPQPNKAIVGMNAFAHEAGIHQDGYLKHPSTYEIMRPEQVGVPKTNLVLGKHSGRHALHERVRDLGYGDLDKDGLMKVYQAFTALADNRKGLTNEDIETLLGSLGYQKQTQAAVL